MPKYVITPDMYITHEEQKFSFRVEELKNDQKFHIENNWMTDLSAYMPFEKAKVLVDKHADFNENKAAFIYPAAKYIFEGTEKELNKLIKAKTKEVLYSYLSALRRKELELEVAHSEVMEKIRSVKNGVSNLIDGKFDRSRKDITGTSRLNGG